MKFTMLGNANQAGPVRLSDVYTSNVGDASMGIAASQKALYQAYNSLNSSKISNTGGVITGDLVYKHPTIDLKQANNGIGNNTYQAMVDYRDKNNLIAARIESAAITNGNITSTWYCRNYKTDGTQVGSKGISMTMNKSGTLTYAIGDSINFVTAVTQNVVWTGRKSYSNTSYNHQTAIKDFIDTQMPTGAIRIGLVEITCGSSKIFVVQKYSQHNYASYIGIGYDGNLVIGKKVSGTWSAQKTVGTV